MAKLSLCLVLCLAVSAFGIEKKTTKNFLNDGRAEAKLLRLNVSAQKVAELVKNLNFKTPAGTEQFIDMANDAVYACRTALYEINQGIPSIKSFYLKENLLHIADSFNQVVAHKVEERLHGDPEELKSALTSALNNVADLSRVIPMVLGASDCRNEIVLSNQFKKATSEGIFGVVKLKNEIELFKKTNKDLVPEIDASLEAFCKSLQKIQSDDQRLREELIHLVQDLERVEARAVAKLENYVNINNGEEKSITIVKEVSKGLSKFRDELHQLSCGDLDATHFKTELEDLYRKATNLVKKLQQIEIKDNASGGLLLRSVLFDSVAFSYYGERELKSINPNSKLVKK